MLIRTMMFGLTALSMASCALPPPEPTVPFDPASVAWANGTGTASVVGQGFYTTDQMPLPVTCAGSVVRLIPYTPYTVAQTNTWTAKIVWSNPPPPGHQPYPERTSICDAQGNFAFDDLPPGKWIVFVSMAVKNREGYTMMAFHGNYKAVVETGRNDTHRVILTNPT